VTESLDDRIEASEGRGLDRRDSLHQLSLHGDDEVQTPKAHVRTRGLVDAVAGHLKLMKATKCAKGPYLAYQLSVFGITD
jgi:hypothetical protein